MHLTNLELLDSLRCANWRVAAQTYGNSHATLTGLLVNWWIGLAPDAHTALESGPSFRYRQRSVGGDMCDAMLALDGEALGVVEVEGLRGKLTAEKLGKFFEAEHDGLAGLKFGILLLYALKLAGRRPDKLILPPREEETFSAVAGVTREYPGKAIIVVTLDKVFEPQASGIRSRSDLYWGRPRMIAGHLYEGGREVASRIYYKG